MEYLLIWLVFPCAAYSTAKTKKRNPYLWAGIALLIGPFAILIVSLLDMEVGENQDYK